MTSKAMLAALLLCATPIAFAQQPRLQPLEMKPSVIRPIEVAPPPEAQPSSLQLNTEEAQLKRELAQLRRENDKLKSENAACGQRLANFTALGGSEVHAYCSAETVSTNTAGATSDCGPYDCEASTGTCLTQCQQVDQCAKGFVCTPDRRCEAL